MGKSPSEINIVNLSHWEKIHEQLASLGSYPHPMGHAIRRQIMRTENEDTQIPRSMKLVLNNLCE
jgi:hypothetical protein